MVFDLIFGKKKNQPEFPDISFGRYSDNNKSVARVGSWTSAELLFTEGRYFESIELFFEYLRDDAENNVLFHKDTPSTAHFEIYQGSKIIRGKVNEQGVYAETILARMPEPNTPVMRRLLEMNFRLFYSRYALNGKDLCMCFDSPLETANPNKLYYGLKELCVKADKQDDLLIQEFNTLEPVDTRHIEAVPDVEKEIKYRYYQQWLNTTLEYSNTLDAEKFSGAISYMLLTLVFRIDYLLRPEGRLLSDLEQVAEKYFSQTGKSAFTRNQEMKEALEKLREKPRGEVLSGFFRSRYTFSIVSPVASAKISENLKQALDNMRWYRDNQHALIANEVMEYGMAYNQFSYSLAKPLSALHQVFMQVNHSNFFKDLGFSPAYYDLVKSTFNTEAITDAIHSIIQSWKPKYPSLNFNTRKLKFDGLVQFNQSFVEEVSKLKTDL